MEFFYYLFALFSFLAVVLALEGTYLAWNNSRGTEAQRLKRRLRAMAAGEHGAAAAGLIKQQAPSDLSALERMFLELPHVHRLERLMLQAGASQSVSHFLLTCLAAGAAVLLVSSIMGLPLWISLALAISAGLYPLLRLITARKKRLQMLEQQLPDALDLMGRGLRAGHAFSGTLGMVGTECNEPIAGEFRTTFDEINFGIPLTDALLNLSTRVPSTDLSYFVIAVQLQKDTGGNLAELLDNLSALIRARFKLLGTIRALSAEGRLSAWILGLLPFVAAALLNILSPKLMSVLWTDPAGLKLIAAALVMMALGILWMRQIIKIRI